MPEIIYRKLKDVKLLANNPREIGNAEFQTLCKSVADNPDYFEARPLILSDRTGELVTIAGNMRYRAAKHNKQKEVPTILLSGLTQEREAEIIIRDNVNNGSWDADTLANEWSDYPLADWGLDVPGFEEVEPETRDAEPQMDKAAELNKKWKVETGDLWLIGEHRLVCGDSGLAGTLLRLMGDERAELFITDPPYNIDFHAQRNQTGYDASDDDLRESEYLSLLSAVYYAAKEYFDNAVITCGKQNLKLWLTNFDIAEVGVWIAKNKMSGGRVSHLSLWEPVLFLGKFPRDSRATDLFEFNTKFQEDADGHPCPKQPEFFADIIQSFSKGSVLDSFAGSGTTLVACQNLNRKCYAIEISENYCAVILERMQTAFPELEIKRVETAQMKAAA